MIAWMQKHNKYLVITIWIATIAFIGAGFVGWGSYQYGSKAGSIAKVGSVKISQEKFNFAYQNLYRSMAERFGGNFDEAKAKELQLPKRAYQSLVAQAYLLNLADEYGVVVSEEELALAIASTPMFQNNGRFDKTIYQTFLQSRRLKAKTFEAILRDDLRIQKLMGMLDQDAVPFEVQVVAGAFSIQDKIRYEVITPDQVQVPVDEQELRSYWEAHKGEYMTPRKYTLSLYWTDTKDLNVTESELKEFYQKNSFNYTDAQGKEFGFEKARPLVEQDYKIKKGKKAALLDYIALKKGKKSPEKSVKIAEGDATLPPAMWEQVRSAEKGIFLKPKPVGTRYVTVRVDGVEEPREMSFEEAKSAVSAAWLKEAKAQAIKAKAEALTKAPDKLTKVSDYLKVSEPKPLPPLNSVESLQFLQKLFTSNKKIGMISINKKVVVYSIVDQKMGEGDQNVTRSVSGTATQIKKSELSQRLLESLAQKYPVQAFVKGF